MAGARLPKFFTVVTNVCGYSVWHLLHVMFLTPRILMWLLHFLKLVDTSFN